MVSFQGRICVHVSIKGPIKQSQHLSQHGPTFVVVTMYHARSNGHNNLTKFQEQNKCCDDVETKFKIIQTHHNMSQHRASRHYCEGWSNGLNIGSQQN